VPSVNEDGARGALFTRIDTDDPVTGHRAGSPRRRAPTHARAIDVRGDGRWRALDGERRWRTRARCRAGRWSGARRAALGEHRRTRPGLFGEASRARAAERDANVRRIVSRAVRLVDPGLVPRDPGHYRGPPQRP